MRPLGRGPEALLDSWPEVPVLLSGPADSGRRTWTEFLLRHHQARDAMVLRADSGLSMDQARELRWWLGIRSRFPRWASVDLDQTSAAAQNALLKTLEEPPAAARVILRGQKSSVLATISSRCRVIRLLPSPAGDEIEFVEMAADVTPEEASQAVAAARGRPGLALRIAGQSEVAQRAYGLVQAAMSGDRIAVASGLADPSADWAAVREWLRRGATERAGSGRLPLRALAAARDVQDPKLAVRLALERLVPDE